MNIYTLPSNKCPLAWQSRLPGARVYWSAGKRKGISILHISKLCEPELTLKQSAHTRTLNRLPHVTPAQLSVLQVMASVGVIEIPN